MKKSTHVFLLLIAFCSTTLSMSAQDNYPNYQIGMQATFPLGGLSGKVNLTENHTAQAVVGLFGPLSSYFGRYAYHFQTKETNWGGLRPYGFGQLGYFKYDFETFGLNNSSENNIGYGAGFGIELWNKNFIENLKFSTEIGYNKVNIDAYELKSIYFGFGLHYQFEL